jgi:glutaredoxin
MSSGDSLHVYDRLLDVKDVNKKDREWLCKCPYCKSEKMLISPIGIAYRQDSVDNFSDLPLPIRNYYKELPNIVEAVMRCVDMEKGTRFTVECLDCKQGLCDFYNEPPDNGDGLHNISRPDKVKLHRYLVKFYGIEEAMRV